MPSVLFQISLRLTSSGCKKSCGWQFYCEKVDPKLIFPRDILRQPILSNWLKEQNRSHDFSHPLEIGHFLEIVLLSANQTELRIFFIYIYIYVYVDKYLKELSNASKPRLFKTQLGPVAKMQLLAFRLGIEPATPLI